MVCVTIDDIRLSNLQSLVTEFVQISRLAEATGLSEKYISQVLNRTPLPSGRPRNLGRRAIRSLEEHTGKYPGWMDEDHRPKPETTLTPEENKLLINFRRASRRKQELLLGLAVLPERKGD